MLLIGIDAAQALQVVKKELNGTTYTVTFKNTKMEYILGEYHYEWGKMAKHLLVTDTKWWFSFSTRSDLFPLLLA
jgi:hypothetical protein